MLVIPVPRFVNDVRNMYEFFNKLFDDNGRPRDDEITLNFRSLGFVKPQGLTALANVTRLLQKKECRVTYRAPNAREWETNKNSPMRFLDDSGYFKRFLGRQLSRLSYVRDTTIPLRDICVEEYHGWLDATVKPWISRTIGRDIDRCLPEFGTCIQEIFNNIDDHSTERIGCCAMQHYPRESRITIAISDFGVGIPYNVQRVRPDASDAECLECAIEQGFSTRSTPRNRGAGLDTLIHNVVNQNQGIVEIHSHKGSLFAEPDGITTKTPDDPSHGYPGTLINISLRTDTIPSADNLAEDFSW